MNELAVKLAVTSFKRLALLSFIGLIFFATVGHFFSHAFASSPPLQSNPNTEQWVLTQVASGNVADLRGEFPAESDRVLSVGFLEDLLTGTKNIHIPRNLIQIAGANVTQQINFRGANIPYEVRLTDCGFDNYVDFSHCVFSKSLSLISCTFKTVNFYLASVSGDLCMSSSTFSKQACFQGITVRGCALFENATFSNQAVFIQADIDGQFIAEGASFTNKAQWVYFMNMEVSSVCNFYDAEFAGPVNVGAANMGSDVILDDVTFSKQLEFIDADIKGSLCSRNTTFNDITNFSLTNIGGHAMFSESVFSEAVYFSDIIVEGAVDFYSTNFSGNVFMERSKFPIVDFTEISWPEETKTFQLEGITYNEIRFGDEEESSDRLLALVGDSVYSSSVYTDLASFYRNRGEINKANEVFITQKRRERSEKYGGPLHEETWWRWWLSQFVDTAVLYGLQPWRMLMPCAFFFLVGVAVFWSEKNMRLIDEKITDKNYNPWWYSFDLFIPFVDLKIAHLWAPDEAWFRIHYRRIHIFLGWILIPIALLALFGVIE